MELASNKLPNSPSIMVTNNSSRLTKQHLLLLQHPLHPHRLLLLLQPPPPPPPPPPPGPPAAPPAPQGGGAPPPPPPPAPNLQRSDSMEPMSGLAAALQAAKLKKTNGPKTSSGSPGSANDVSNGNASNYGTVGRSTSGSGGGMASMMDEMQKTLARRRAKVDRSSEEPDGEAERTNHYAEAGSAATKGSSPGKNVPNAGSESPKPGRRRHSRRSR